MPIANCYKYNDKIIPFRVVENEIKKNAKIKIYPDGQRCKIICWDKPMYTPVGYEKAEINYFNRLEEEKSSVPLNDVAVLPDLFSMVEDKSAEKNKSASGEKNIKDAMKRAKDKIFEIAMANKWEWMITLTLDQEKIDRYDKTEVLKVISKWFDNQVQRRKLKYLIVPEYHKDKAIHFHGLVSGQLDFEFSKTYKIKGVKQPVKINTLTRRGLTVDNVDVKEVYNVNNFPYGFSTALPLDGNTERVAMYMTKYITKDLQKIFGSYYKAGGKIKRELDFVLMDVDFIQMLDFEDCKTVYLPDNLGSVRYATADLSDLYNLKEKLYDVKTNDGIVYFIDDNGVICEERKANKC